MPARTIRSLRVVTAPVWIGAVLSSACTSEVAGNLDEAAANRVVAALDQAGIPASKEADSREDQRWLVTVPHDDETPAVALLSQQGLPREEPPTVLDALGGDTLVLSPAAERAKLMSGVAGELQRSLNALNGVVDARVHLAAALRPAEAEDEPLEPAGSAGVLLRYQSATPPISEADVQRLVSAAVPEIAPGDVKVVMVPSAAHAPDARLIRIGPLGIARASLGTFRACVATLVLLNLVLIGSVTALWLKLRKLHTERARIASSGSLGLDDPGEAR